MNWCAALVLASLLFARLAEADEPDEADDVPTQGDDRPAASPPIVELYTMGQGEILFEKFGHAALCLVSTQGPRKTTCYNYGAADFDEFSSLVWGFLRGRSVFWLSTSSRGRMLAHYRATDRSLWRQVIPLAPEKASELERLLRENAREENRYYVYHHFKDNCSTRVRDLLDEVTGGKLSAAGSGPARPSYRELSRIGFADSPSLLLLSDLLLGRSADHRPSTFEAMFLPDVLREEVAARLGVKPELVYERRGPPFANDPGMGDRWLWLVLALALAAPIAVTRLLERGERIGLAAAAFPLALFGIVLWALAVVSSLAELRVNEVLLVFLPTDLALPFLRPALRTRYATVRVALLVLVALLLAAGVLRQPLWYILPMPFLPMILAALPRRSLRETAVAPELAAGG